MTARKPKEPVDELVRSVEYWTQQVDRERQARDNYERLMRQRLVESGGMSDDINRAEAAVRHFTKRMEKGARGVMDEAIEAVKLSGGP